MTFDWKARRSFIEAQAALLWRNGLMPWDARIAAAKDWESLQTFIHMKPGKP